MTVERGLREKDTRVGAEAEIIMDESERVKSYNNEILSQKLTNDQKITELLKRLEGQ